MKWDAEILLFDLYQRAYPISENRPDFLVLLPPSGTSLIFCSELLAPVREVRRDPLSDPLLPLPSPFNTPTDSCDFLLKVLLLDSDSDRGFLRANRSSDTELRAWSFCLAAGICFFLQYETNLISENKKDLLASSTFLKKTKLKW